MSIFEHLDYYELFFSSYGSSEIEWFICFLTILGLIMNGEIVSVQVNQYRIDK